MVIEDVSALLKVKLKWKYNWRSDIISCVTRLGEDSISLFCSQAMRLQLMCEL